MKTITPIFAPIVIVAVLCGAARAGAETMAEKMVITPAGPRPASEVHALPPGHVLDASEGRLRERDASGKVVRDFGPQPAGSDGAPPPPAAPSDK